MSKLSDWLGGFFGALLALFGASLVGWQAVLIYYLFTGRVKAGEEHPPLIMAIVILVIGLLLLAAGYHISRLRISRSK